MNALIGTLLVKAILIGVLAAVCYVAVIALLNIKLMAVGQRGIVRRGGIDRSALRDLVAAAKLSNGEIGTTRVARVVCRSVNNYRRH